MGRKYLKERQKIIILKIIATIILTVIFYCAIKIGAAGGNYFYRSDFKIVKKVDVENFKKILNSSLPLIDATYNSGSLSNPFITQVKKTMRIFSGFSLSSPITILNSQASYFYAFYKNDYATLINRTDKGEKDEEEPDSMLGENGVYEKNPKIKEEERKENNNENEQIEKGGDEDGRISYCFYENEENELEMPKENIISGQEITIQNMTKLSIDANALLKEPLSLEFNRNGPKIMIYHTHTTESFIKRLEDLNKKDVPVWSLDPQESVVRVGHELAELLRKKYGYDVVHNGTIHDYPDFGESYNNAYTTINNYLKSYPSIKVIFDIHRDGLSANQPKLRLTTQIGGKDVAKIMFVVGTNTNRSEHINWKENLKLAIKLQENLNRQHPGLARHIYISSNAYNQNLSKGSLLIEIGGDGNLLSECLESVKYLAKAISEVIN